MNKLTLALLMGAVTVEQVKAEYGFQSFFQSLFEDEIQEEEVVDSPEFDHFSNRLAEHIDTFEQKDFSKKIPVRKRQVKSAHPRVESTHEVTLTAAADNVDGLLGNIFVGTEEPLVKFDSTSDWIVLKTDLRTEANEQRINTADSSTYQQVG